MTRKHLCSYASGVEAILSPVQGVTQNMLRSASKWGCFLGFFREDFLRWSELSEQLANMADEPSGSRDVLACIICLSALVQMCLQTLNSSQAEGGDVSRSC